MLFALNALGEEPRVILEEDFERYTNTVALNAAWSRGRAVLEFRSPGGGQAARHEGVGTNRWAGFSILPSPTQHVVLTADFFDFGTNANKRLTVWLRSRAGFQLEMGTVETGGAYAARVQRAGTSVENWTAFNRTQQPVYGWHRFQAILSHTNTLATLDLDANGKVDCSLSLPDSSPNEALTEVGFGGLPGRTLPGGPVLIDNIRLELVPARAMPTALDAVVRISEPADGRGTAVLPDGDQPGIVVVGASTDVTTWWIAVALALILALLVWLVMTLRRGGPGASMALVPVAGGPPGLTHEKALAELTEFAKQSLVQGLYEQRNALLETHQQAQQALLELERRLAALQLPQAERIQAYERRIVELEKELETRGEAVRELTEATLLLVRRKLEEEKGLDRRRDQFN